MCGRGYKSDFITLLYIITLFLLFINDLPLSLHDTIYFVDLYADDTTIYEQQSDMTTLQCNLQKSLNLLHEWCRKNGMVFIIKYFKD